MPALRPPTRQEQEAYEKEAAAFERGNKETAASFGNVGDVLGTDELDVYRAMEENESFFGSVGTHSKKSIANTVASTLGVASDMAQMLLDAGKYGPPSQANPLAMIPRDGPSSIRVPGTSEHIAANIGGDPNHWSWWPAQIFSPGPGELKSGGAAVREMVAGQRGAKNLPDAAQRIKRLEEFKQKDYPVYDKTGYQETGWYKGTDGQPRFMISDADSTINRDSIAKDVSDNPVEVKIGQYSRITKPLEEVLNHPTLFEAYPELRKLPIQIFYRRTGKNQFVIESENMRTKGHINTRSFGDQRFVSSMNVKNADNMEDFRSTVLHETQHVVQELEKLSLGGSSALAGRDLDMVAYGTMMKDSFKVIDKFDASNPDELFMFLRQKGYKDKQIKALFSDEQSMKILQEYMVTLDDIERGDIVLETEAITNSALDRTAFFIDFLARKEGLSSPEGAKLIELLTEKLKFEDMNDLRHRAYENLLGEAEARLTQVLRNTTKEGLEKMGPVNPTEAPRSAPQDRGLGLNVGEVPSVPAELAQTL